MYTKKTKQVMQTTYTPSRYKSDNHVVFTSARKEGNSSDNASEMSPGSSTESYPAFARIGLRENPGKNLNLPRPGFEPGPPGFAARRADRYSTGYLVSERGEGDNAGKMSPGSSTESYPAFAQIWLRKNLEKNLEQDALEGMVNRREVRGRKSYQMIDNIKIHGSYEETEKKAEEKERLQNTGFAVKYLPLGSTL
ncbi:hypothetical protein ANN_14830 [Periplaneta americana]|uniref:Uncharacterized protein n=1 Tax=Periplaneta americana TaxID=6978 RepID=A0ABQ8SYW9_PERAM|nr:hypothetical protein ANN_14830 [Periplaneta americana]